MSGVCMCVCGAAGGLGLSLPDSHSPPQDCVGTTRGAVRTSARSRGHTETAKTGKGWC